jgi:hypothetical protein
MIKKICPACDNEFETNKKNKIYCSVNCSTNYKTRKERLSEYRKKHSLYNKKYRKTFKGESAMFRYHSKRRIKFPINLTPEEMNFIRQRDNGRCVYCECEVFEYPLVPRFSPRQLTFDHIDPNGPTSVKNIVLACRECNISKNDKNVFEWCEEKGFEVPKIVIELLKKQKNIKSLINTSLNDYCKRIQKHCSLSELIEALKKAYDVQYKRLRKEGIRIDLPYSKLKDLFNFLELDMEKKLEEDKIVNYIALCSERNLSNKEIIENWPTSKYYKAFNEEILEQINNDMKNYI